MLDFSRHIADSTVNFTGRVWVFEEISKWLAQSTGSRFFLLRGEPGSGKTSLAARLSQFSSAEATPPDSCNSLTPGFLTAIHFCSARDSTSVDPLTFARSLASQLVRKFPQEYTAALDIEEAASNVYGQAQAETVHQGAIVAGVYLENLVLSGIDPRQAFNRSICNPLENLYNRGFDKSITILVDSLDEALTYDNSVTIVRLLAGLKTLPAPVRFILTSRKDGRVENELLETDGISISAPEHKSKSRQDIFEYVEDRLCKEHNLAEQLANTSHSSRAAVAAKITDKADENFQYVTFLLNAMAQGHRSLEELDGLPAGLDKLYAYSLKRVVMLGKNEWSRCYAPVMGILSVAQEALTFAQLRAFTGFRESMLWGYLGDLQQFVETPSPKDQVAKAEKTYRLYHQALVDFLRRQKLGIGELDDNLYFLAAEEWHRLVADFYLGTFHGKWSDCDAYGLRHLPWHLKEARNFDNLRQLLLSFGWLQATLEQATEADSVAGRQLLGYPQTIYESPLEIGAELPALMRLFQRQSAVLSRFRPVQRHFLIQQIYNGAVEVGLERFQNEARRQLRELQATWVRLIWKAENESAELECTFSLNKSRVFSVALSPDGKLAAAGDEDGNFKVWDIETGLILHALVAENAPLLHGVRLTHSDVGGYQLSRFTGSTLTLWKVATKTLLSRFRTTEDFMFVSASADGRWVVFMEGATVLRLNDVQRGWACSIKFDKEMDPRRVRAAIDGARGQAVVSTESQIWLMKYVDASDSEVTEIAYHGCVVLELAISDCGRFAAGRFADDTVRIWDLDVRSEVSEFRCNSGRGLAFLGNQEVVVPDALTVKVWDFVTRRLTRALVSHTARVQAVTGTPGSQRLASADASGTVKIWNLKAASGQATQNVEPEPVLALAATPDTCRLVSVNLAGTRSIWDARTGTRLHAWAGARLTLLGAKITPNARYAILSSPKNQFDVWDLKTGAKTCQLNIGRRQLPTSWAVSSDSRHIVIGTDQGMLKIWNVRTGRELSTLQDSDPLDVFSRTNLSPEERREIAFSYVKEYVSPTGVLAVTFTQDNRHVVAFHRDRLMRQWDIRTRRPSILRENAACDQILLIPKSDRAVACLSNRLYVWDLKSGHGNLLAHYPTEILPNAMQVDPRGRYVIFCLVDRRMVLWDLRTCRELAHLPFDHSPQCVSIAPDDDAVFVADTIGNVYRLAVEGLA